MFTLEQLLKNEEIKYREILGGIEKLNIANNEWVEVKRRGNKSYFYYSKNGIKKRIKSFDEIPKSVIAKKYLKDTKRLVEKRLNQLIKLNSNYRHQEIGKLYELLRDDRKKLFVPFEMTYKDYVEKWKLEPSERLKSPETYNLTIRGEKVRSKSEKILADMFHNEGLEYIYEKMLKFNDGYKIYPDFTFISPIDNKEIYWEHFGMMDNLEYVTKAIRKIRTYERNGILLGQRLIVTFETKELGLDYERIRNIIQNLLLPK